MNNRGKETKIGIKLHHLFPTNPMECLRDVLKSVWKFCEPNLPIQAIETQPPTSPRVGLLLWEEFLRQPFLDSYTHRISISHEIKVRGKTIENDGN